MMKMLKTGATLAVAILLAAASRVPAADPAQTVITLPTMCCQGCVKKVTQVLMQVPGVGNVQANLQAKTVFVTPRSDVVPSPRAMWEATERINKVPAKMEGPSGTFTSKPVF